MTERVGVEKRSAVIGQALRNPALRRVLVAFLLFEIAEWASWIALLVWGFSIGGVRGTSAIALVQLVPSAFLAAPAAALFGRFPRGVALCAAYGAQAVSLLVVGLLLTLDAPVAVIAATAAASALTMTLSRPPHHALLPEISRTTGDLTAGNAATGSLEAVANFVGPLVSGLLIAVWGAGGVLLAMSAAALVSVALTLRLGGVTPRRARHPAHRRRDRPIRVVLRNPAARLMTALVAAEYALVGMMDILLVVLALDLLGMSDAGPGVLNSAVGIGGIVGAAATFVLIGRPRLAGPLLLGAVIAGVSFGLSGLAHSVAVAIALIAFCGAGKAFYDVASRTFVQRLLPDHLLTAMFGLQESVMMGAIAVGTLAAPLLVHVLGARSAFAVAGVFLPLVAVASYRVLRRLDAEATIPEEALALFMQVPTLAVLAPRIVERLARDATPRDFEGGVVVVGEAEVGHEFFVIESGSFRVSRGDHVLRELVAGQWFGEIALLRDVPRTATVTAVTPARVWAIDRDSFLSSVGSLAQSVEIADTHIRENYL